MKDLRQGRLVKKLLLLQCHMFPMAYESEARSKQSATSISRFDDR